MIVDPDGGSSYERSLEDVSLVIAHAKLELKELRPITQVLYMSEKPSAYKLLELNEDVLTALQGGQEVLFRGLKEDRAVLCTSNKTFEVKEAETSNSLLLTPELRFPENIPLNGSSKTLEVKEVVDIHHSYLELRAVRPVLCQLRSSLVNSPYRGSELESDEMESNFPTTEQLLQTFQFSQEELMDALKQLKAFQIKGRWRVLEFDYEFRCLSFLLNLIDENSWRLDEIPLGETLKCLGELLPKEVLLHIIETYLSPSGDLTDEGEEAYALDKKRVSKFLAEVLLRQAEKFNLNDFLQAWEQSVPEGVKTDLSDLGGMALWENVSDTKVISYHPESKFSEDLQQRFSELFQIREKWTLEQISPYIQPLIVGKQTVNGLLTKHARCSNVNGVRYYSSRHGK